MMITSPADTAKATALMVKLGLLNLVRDIVAKLSQQGRADVVSQVNQLYLCCTVAAFQSPNCFQPPCLLKACPG